MPISNYFTIEFKCSIDKLKYVQNCLNRTFDELLFLRLDELMVYTNFNFYDLTD